jgi:hypothetical protein
MRQNTSRSRSGFHRGANRDAAEAPHPDGWSVAGSSAPTRQPPKAGDLSQFGKIGKTAPISFGPGSTFTSKEGKNRGPPMSHTPSTSSNMFSMPQNPDVAAAEPSTSQSSWPPSRKPSVDLGAGALSDATAIIDSGDEDDNRDSDLSELTDLSTEGSSTPVARKRKGKSAEAALPTRQSKRTRKPSAHVRRLATGEGTTDGTSQGLPGWHPHFPCRS